MLILMIWCFVVLLVVLCCFLFVFVYDDGVYWYDIGVVVKNLQWMLIFGVVKKFIELLLLGMYDSGIFFGIGGDIVCIQMMIICEQFDLGICYLDICLKYYDCVVLCNCNDNYQLVNCEMLVFYGGVDMFLFFESGVFKFVILFLRDNLFELVIMCVVCEFVDCDCNFGEVFNVLLEWEVVINGVGIGQKYLDYLLCSSCLGFEVLMLGFVWFVNVKFDLQFCDVCGKLLVLDQYLDFKLFVNYFYCYNGMVNYMVLMFEMLCINFDFYDWLWMLIKKQLVVVVKDIGMMDFYFNVFSGFGGGFLYFFVSGYFNFVMGVL